MIGGLRSRLEKIESASGAHGMIVIFSLGDETPEQATQRAIAKGSFTEKDRATRPVVVLDEAAARL